MTYQSHTIAISLTLKRASIHLESSNEPGEGIGRPLLEGTDKKKKHLFTVAMKILYFNRRISNTATGKNTADSTEKCFVPATADETVFQASVLS